MYVVTFYSFKGGVGRTMSLVNVAAELAKNGRKILMVDFDLEAPGLSDFELIATDRKTPGMVEFITDYLASGVVPDVTKYVHQSTKYKETGDRLWVMPAGCQNGDYQNLFSSINWQDLYENGNGYLLMEDVRAQWNHSFSPDYVFIDSRTGYTDIAGICTRQLPDSICLLFTPNKQNLTGLTRITAEIKSQSGIRGLRQPKLHFVASNIPNLEDDEDVLKKALGKFSRQLEYVNPAAVIHHYNSYSLISEAVFTIEYPRNPLASEYRLLAAEITRENFQDRFTAMDYLRSTIKLSNDHSDALSIKDADERITQFETYFANDAEVLFWMSRTRRALGSLDAGEILLDAAIENGLRTPRGFLDRAISRINQPDSNVDAIWSDLRQILEMHGGVHPNELLWTLKLANRLGRGGSQEVLMAPAIVALNSEDLLYLADKMHDNRQNVLSAVAILGRAIDENRIEPAYLDDALSLLAIRLIAVGNLGRAVSLIESMKNFHSELPDLTSTFNYAMAKFWLLDSTAPSYFEKIIRVLSIDMSVLNSNYLQCLSFSYFALGQNDEAMRVLRITKEKVGEQPGMIFSCWRYLETSPSRFKEDLSEMEELYLGKQLLPIFCRGV